MKTAIAIQFDSGTTELQEAADHAFRILDILKESPELFTREMGIEKCLRDLEAALDIPGDDDCALCGGEITGTIYKHDDGRESCEDCQPCRCVNPDIRKEAPGCQRCGKGA